MTRSLGATPSIVSMVRLGLRSSSRVALVMGRYCPTSADRSWGRCPARWRDALSPLAAPSRCLDPLSVFAVDDSAPAAGPACLASPRCRVWTSASASAAPRSRRGSPGAVPGSVSRVLSGRCHAARVRSARDRSGPRLEDLFSWTPGPVPLLRGVGPARPVQTARVSGTTGPRRAAQALVRFVLGACHVLRVFSGRVLFPFSSLRRLRRRVVRACPGRAGFPFSTCFAVDVHCCRG